MPSRPSIFDWPPQLLVAELVQGGLRPGQARQAVAAIGHALWRQGLAWPEALGQVGKAAQEALRSVVAGETAAQVAADYPSRDGSRKLLIQLEDAAQIEAVILPAHGKGRTTLCVSSQVGCGRRCVFCETGRVGLRRNLRAGEITEQLWLAQQVWAEHRGPLPPITNVVFMGMGEPLDNLAAVADAVAVFTDDLAAGLAWRHITVSTVGVAERLPAFFRTVRANLAVSLNAPDDTRRSQLMPVNQRCDLAALKLALQTQLPPGREVLVEYILFAGVNDSLADAAMLRQWLDGVPARCNLIPANPGPDAALQTPTVDAVWRFQKAMLDAGVRTLVRHPHGRDVGGACGQLAGQRHAAVPL